MLVTFSITSTAIHCDHVGRATITGTWQNLPQAMTARRLQRTACWHTRLQVIRQTMSCRPLIRSDLDLRSTSPSSTTRSWTRLTAPADWQRLHSMMRLPSLTRWVRSRTRTRRSSCSCCETTSRCGHQICRLMMASCTPFLIRRVYLT